MDVLRRLAQQSHLDDAHLLCCEAGMLKGCVHARQNRTSTCKLRASSSCSTACLQAELHPRGQTPARRPENNGDKHSEKAFLPVAGGGPERTKRAVTARKAPSTKLPRRIRQEGPLLRGQTPLSMLGCSPRHYPSIPRFVHPKIVSSATYMVKTKRVLLCLDTAPAVVHDFAGLPRSCS